MINKGLLEGKDFNILVLKNLKDILDETHININNAYTCGYVAISTGLYDLKKYSEIGLYMVEAFSRAIICGLKPASMDVELSFPADAGNEAFEDFIMILRQAFLDFKLRLNDIRVTFGDNHLPTVRLTVFCEEAKAENSGQLVNTVKSDKSVKSVYLDNTDSTGLIFSPNIKNKVLPGDSLLMVGRLMEYTSVFMADVLKKPIEEKYSEEFENAVKSLYKSSEALEKSVLLDKEIKLISALSKGGLAAGLWRVGEYIKKGLKVELSDIPVCQETIEMSEIIDVNPYNIYSPGNFLIITQSPDYIVEKLAKKDIFATKIGFITDAKEKIIVSGEQKSFLNVNTIDEFYSIRDI
ncbi:MAG: hypothetical protein K6D02_01385 [Lachnospiraceae bacterium]|nr:hypothetical protein [Lachnospiraceae bacterium]